MFAHHVVVTHNPQVAAEEFAATTGSRLDEIEHSPHVLIGPKEAIIETLIHRREAFGISYVVFDAENFDAVAPIVTQLAGR